MGRISEKNIEKVIENSNIVDVVSEFVPLKRAGRGFMGVCPFHGDKGPSLSVSSEKQLFHCFGCGASGNVVGFIMRIRNMDFIDAIKYLADKAGITIEDEIESPEMSKINFLKESIFKINIEAARFFFNNLQKSSIAIDYFRGREIKDKTIKKFGLGYSINDWGMLHKYLNSKGYNNDLIEKAGLIIKKQNSYYDRFRNRVMFPVIDIKGRIIGFGGRVLDDSKPKYLNSPETPVFFKGTNLYGLNYIAKTGLPDYIVIVEGYMDCISLHQHGIENSVASLGTALTVEQAKLLKRYTKNIYICYDSDIAGQTATLRGLDILEQTGCDVKIISIPTGKDPDEFIKTNGKEKFIELINNAIPVVDFRIQRAKNGKNLKDVREKSKFIKEVAHILSTRNNEIEIQVYSTKIFDETGVDVKTILDEVERIKKKKSEGNNKPVNINSNNNVFGMEPAFKKAERNLLKHSLDNKEYFNYIKENLGVDEFITPAYRISAEYLYQKVLKDENIIPSELLIKFTDLEAINDVSRIFEEDEKDESNSIDTTRLLDDYIKTIKKYNIENRIKELTIEIKRCEANNDLCKSAVLTQELITLQKQLNFL